MKRGSHRDVRAFLSRTVLAMRRQDRPFTGEPWRHRSPKSEAWESLRDYVVSVNRFTPGASRAIDPYEGFNLGSLTYLLGEDWFGGNDCPSLLLVLAQKGLDLSVPDAHGNLPMADGWEPWGSLALQPERVLDLIQAGIDFSAVRADGNSVLSQPNYTDWGGAVPDRVIDLVRTGVAGSLSRLNPAEAERRWGLLHQGAHAFQKPWLETLRPGITHRALQGAIADTGSDAFSAGARRKPRL